MCRPFLAQGFTSHDLERTPESAREHRRTFAGANASSLPPVESSVPIAKSSEYHDHSAISDEYSYLLVASSVPAINRPSPIQPAPILRNTPELDGSLQRIILSLQRRAVPPENSSRVALDIVVMNYHPYGYGYDPYQGQPTHAYPYQADPGHPPSQAQNSNYVPGLYAASSQGSYDQNQNIIPGLAFGNSANDAAWHQQHHQQQPQQAPTLVPAAKYYQNQPTNGENLDHNPPAGTASAEDTVEEGELSEGEDDDFYEPAEAGAMIDEEEDNYEPQESEWANGTAGQKQDASRGASLSRENGTVPLKDRWVEFTNIPPSPRSIWLLLSVLVAP